MVIRHKKNTAYYLELPMVNAATPANFKSELTVADEAYYKDGAGEYTSLSITDTFTEIGTTGIYKIVLIASELNHDLVIIKLTAAGAADSFVKFEMDAQEIDDIPTTPMRGTDSAALATVCTETRLAELDQANLPADIAAIPTTPMRGTDNAALASVCSEARLAELAAANLPADVDTLKTRCTEARLAELDAANLPTDIQAIPTTPALASVCTEARLAELDAANLPADANAIGVIVSAIQAICTETRLAELDAANLPTDIAAIPTTPALASVCTEARLAELGAANLPADVDILKTRCTEARLAELDAANLPAVTDGIKTVTDGIKTKTDALPAGWNMTDLAAVPPINTGIVEALNFVYVLCRNKKITNKTTKEIELYKENSTTKFAESDIDDDGTLFTQGKFGGVD